MIIDIADYSSFVPLLEQKSVLFIFFNSKKLEKDSKMFFATNVYVVTTNRSVLRLRKVFKLESEGQIQPVVKQLTEKLMGYNKQYNIPVFEASIKDEDAAEKLFK